MKLCGNYKKNIYFQHFTIDTLSDICMTFDTVDSEKCQYVVTCFDPSFAGNINDLLK